MTGLAGNLAGNRPSQSRRSYCTNRSRFTRDQGRGCRGCARRRRRHRPRPRKHHFRPGRLRGQRSRILIRRRRRGRSNRYCSTRNQQLQLSRLRRQRSGVVLRGSRGRGRRRTPRKHQHLPDRISRRWSRVVPRHRQRLLFPLPVPPALGRQPRGRVAG